MHHFLYVLPSYLDRLRLIPKESGCDLFFAAVHKHWGNFLPRLPASQGKPGEVVDLCDEEAGSQPVKAERVKKEPLDLEEGQLVVIDLIDEDEVTESDEYMALLESGVTETLEEIEERMAYLRCLDFVSRTFTCINVYTHILYICVCTYYIYISLHTVC